MWASAWIARGRRLQRAEKLPDDQQQHDHEHRINDLAADPLHCPVSAGLARLNAILAFAGLNATIGGSP
jgi:hypothetical protein